MFRHSAQQQNSSNPSKLKLSSYNFCCALPMFLRRKRSRNSELSAPPAGWRVARSGEGWDLSPNDGLSTIVEKGVPQSRDSDSCDPSLATPRVSSELKKVPAARPSTCPPTCLSVYSAPSKSPNESLVFRPLVVHDLRGESPLLFTDPQVRSELLNDLIQTIPAIWLTAPRIRNSFIPLLRPDQGTEDKVPTPRELQLIDNLLNNLPELRIVSDNTAHREAEDTGEKSLVISSDVLYTPL